MFELKNHRVRYYETDNMGVVHHSNYIRWFELARDYYLESLGMTYKEVEDIGIISMIRKVDAKYLFPVRYGDKVDIKVKLVKYNGIRYIHEYEVYANDKLCVTGSSELVNVSRETYRAVNAAKAAPEYNNLILGCLQESFK